MHLFCTTAKRDFTTAPPPFLLPEPLVKALCPECSGAS
uniref:Uncharacterized protein n=1 Tax=Anguilla anguilla TaxID=7936 RepID=A0A0E9W5H4_ANGAN